MPQSRLAANLPPKAVKVLKSLHILCVGSLLGSAGSVLVSLGLMYARGDNLDHLTADMLQASIANGLFLWAFYGLLATGVVYALFTSWGFFRHTWIVFKWVGLVIMVFITINGLIPAVDGMAALSDGLYSIPNAREIYSELFRQAAISSSLVIGIGAVLVGLSVFKPFGLMQLDEPSLRTTIAIRVVILLLAGGAVAATITGSARLEKYRRMEIAHVEPAFIPDGVYQGSARDGNFTYVVKVTVRGKTIVKVVSEVNRSSLYARYAEGVFTRVINNQSPAVDVITGATTTSKMLLKAVEDALSRANRKEGG